MLPSPIPFAFDGPTLTTGAVFRVLLAHGVPVDEVRFAPGSWPGQVDLLGYRGGEQVLSGAVALEFEVHGDHAVPVGEIRIVPEVD